MSDATQLPQIFNVTPPASALLDASSRWTDDDLALGCECAYPSLQIERWGQESVTAMQSAC